MVIKNGKNARKEYNLERAIKGIAPIHNRMQLRPGVTGAVVTVLDGEVYTLWVSSASGNIWFPAPEV